MADMKKETIEAAEETAAVTDTEIQHPDGNDDALESFLSREHEDKKTVKTGKSRKTILMLIIAAVVVAGLVLALILIRSTPVTSEDSLESAGITLDVSEDGVHEAAVTVDENGNILQNGTGSLLSYVPADISEINVENQDGSFTVTSSTPEGEATIYKLIGFEDYTLQAGIADEIASHSAALDFGKIISADGNLSDFGLDKPRAKVKIKYNDDTTAVIRVGNDAAGENAGAYVAFGSSDAVYLVNSDDVSCFFYSVNSFISRDITDTMEDSDNTEFSTLTISGTHFNEPITIEPNKDDAIDAAYIVTSPRRMYANATESYDIAGNIRGLYAEEVVCVNPSKSQMQSYGLSEPYAKAEASYADTDIILIASAPGDDGLVYIYNPDKNVIYTIQLAAVSWAKTSLDLLLPENPLNVRIKYVNGIHFTAGDTDFSIDVDSTTETVTDDDGNEQEVTNTTATCNGKTLSEENFSIFFQNLNAIKNQGSTDSNGKEKMMSVTLTYSTDRDSDTLTVYSSDATQYTLELNGEKIGVASKSFIDNLIKGANNLINDEPVNSL